MPTSTRTVSVSVRSPLTYKEFVRGTRTDFESVRHVSVTHSSGATGAASTVLERRWEGEN